MEDDKLKPIKMFVFIYRDLWKLVSFSSVRGLLAFQRKNQAPLFVQLNPAVLFRLKNKH